jgi:Spy/CpxP family protein refolding chaperone
MTRIWMAALALLAAGLVAAEDPAVQAQKDRDGRAMRDEVDEVVDAYLLMKVQERVGLTDEQFAKLVPLIKRQQRERRDLDSRRFHALREMRRLFAKGEATDERIGSLLRDLKAAEVELPETIRRNAEAIDAVLTPVQQAKYRLLNAEVERHLHDLRWQARERRHGGGRGAGEPGLHRHDADPRP